MMKDFETLFFYGMVMFNPRWETGYILSDPRTERYAAEIFTAFAQGIPDLEMFEWYDLDYYWMQQGDPVSIGCPYQEYPYLPYLAVRESLHQEDSFTLPDPIDWAAWNDLLRAKCEAHHLTYEAFAPPRFYIMYLQEG